MIIDEDTARGAACAADLGGEAVRPEYSGRAMYGATCLGIVHDSLDQLIDFVVAMAEDGVSLRGARQDSMGHSTITYWPGVQVEGYERESRYA